MKLTKYQVSYEPEASNPKERCSICEHYLTKRHSNKSMCEIVEGYVEPKGWCSKFKKDKS